MRRRSLVTELLIAAGCVAVAAAGTWWINTANSGAPYARGTLFVDERAVDFGDVWGTNDFHWILPVANTSDVAVSIESITTSCACVAVEPRQATLGPGKKLDLHLTLDLSTADSEEAAKEVRPFVVQVTAHTDYGTHPSWQLTGRVRSAFSVTPTMLDFGESLVYGEPYRPRELQLDVGEPGLIVTAVGSENLNVTVDRSEGAFRVLVAPLKSVSDGAFQGNVLVTAITAEGEDRGRIPVSVRGHVVHDIEASPPAVVLGAVSAGESHSETLLLRSRTGRTFDVLTIATEPSDVDAHWAAGSDPSEWIVTVSVPPPCAVNNGGQLRMRLRYSGIRESTTVVVPIAFQALR